MLISDFKKVSKQTFIYGLGGVLGRLFTLISAPILTRIFSPADYGQISLVQITLGLAIIFAGFNISSGFTYYYYFHEKQKTKKNVLTSGILAIIVLGFIVGLILFCSAEYINFLINIGHEAGNIIDISKYIKIGSLGVFTGILKTSFQTILRIKEKPIKYIIAEITTLMASFFFTLLFVIGLGFGIKGIFWGSVGGSTFGMLISLFFCRKYLGNNFSFALLGPILIYALPQMPAGIISWFQSQTGRIFINYYSTLDDQGLYSISFTISAVILLVTNSFRLAYDPYSLSIMKRKDAKFTYAKIFSIYVFIFSILVALISSFAKPILIIFTPPEYYPAYKMIFWLGAGGFILGANNILGIGINITKRTKFISYAQLITFLSVIIFSFLLVPYYGALGASLAYFIGSLFQSCSYYIFAQKLYPIPYSYSRFIFTLFSLILFGALNIYLVDEMNFFSSFLIGIFTLFASSIFSFYISLKNSERRLILKRSFDIFA